MTGSIQGRSRSLRDVNQAAHWSLIAVLVAIPVVNVHVLWSAPGGSGDVNQTVFLRLHNLFLIPLVGLAIADVVERRLGGGRSWTTPAIAASLTLGWYVIAAVVHPSWRAAEWLLHVLAAWAVIQTVRTSTPRQRTMFLAAVASLGAFQAALGITQSLRGSILGIDLLEWPGGLYRFGANYAGRGSLMHPYHLATLLIVCLGAAIVLHRRLQGTRFIWAALSATFVIAVAIPLTFSRTALVALVPVVVLLLSRPGHRSAGAVLLLGLALGGMLGFDGLSDKAEQTVDVERVDSGRSVRLQEASRVFRSEPLFGVGPGRYVIALRELKHEELLPPHNIVAHAAAETGAPGALLVSITALSGAWWLFRRGVSVVITGITLVPFHLLDSYPYAFPTGLVISGLWIATVVCAAEPRDERPKEAGPAPPTSSRRQSIAASTE